MSDKKTMWERWKGWPWWGKAISIYLVLMFVGLVAARLRGTENIDQETQTQVQPTPTRTTQAALSSKLQRALKSLGNVETLALYVAGTKTGEQCAAPSVEMTRAFVQASLDAGDWKGLAQLRKTYEKACASICEQESKAACYAAIIKGVGDWKDWIKTH